MNRTICVYGAASDGLARAYITAAEELGRAIAAEGDRLIFGGGGSGLMGAVARGVSAGGGRVIGVLPRFMTGYENLYDRCDETIVTRSMSDRKLKMERQADAFVILPGGVGTMDEFFEALTLKTLNRHHKPIVVYNVRGFYSKQLAFLEQGIWEGFIAPECRYAYAVCDTPGGALRAIAAQEKAR